MTARRKVSATKMRTAPLLREQVRDATAQAIMSAAEEIFAEQGLNSAHVGEIAARAGVAVGTLYNHFTDREALLIGLLQARRTELLAALDEIPSATFTPALDAFADRIIRHYRAHQRFFRILLSGELGACPGSLPVVAQRAPEIMHALYERAERLMRLGLRERVLEVRPAHVYAALFMGLLRAVMMHDLLALGGTPVEASHVLEVFLHGAQRA